jgi:lipopolysaccharide biosynthesis glycosyltransferase
MDSIWIGFDPREAVAFSVCKYSIMKRMTRPLPVRGIVLDDVQARGLYTRPVERRVYEDGSSGLWDPISDHSMSTEFAISRFLTPHLAGGKGWAVFMDSDFLARDNLTKLFQVLDPNFAVMCVKHNHQPKNAVKMDGQPQTRYSRKNWSSLTAYNCDHPANRALTLELINSVPGRDLHAFCWLEDDSLIGELEPKWNYLVGHTKLADPDNAALVHFTDGFPLMPGYENVEFADEWRREMNAWAKA